MAPGRMLCTAVEMASDREETPTRSHHRTSKVCTGSTKPNKEAKLSGNKTKAKDLTEGLKPSGVANGKVREKSKGSYRGIIIKGIRLGLWRIALMSWNGLK